MGVDGAFLPPWGPAPFFITVTETVGQSRHVDVSLWYAFVGSADQHLLVDEREAADARWWAPVDLCHGPGTRFDPHLPRAVDKLTAHPAEPATYQG